LFSWNSCPAAAAILAREEGLGLGSGGRCAACTYLRRRCDPGDCVLAPYFPASRPRRYADVHAVFGTSNATRLLQVIYITYHHCSSSSVLDDTRIVIPSVLLMLFINQNARIFSRI
jgi:hypothetical protein